MTSGTTEKKTYSKDEILSMLYHFLKQAAADQTKAIAAFNEANSRVRDKLEKNGITLTEFVDYSNKQDANA